MARHRFAALAAVAALSLASCGGGDDPEQVLKDYLTAAEAGDEKRACELVSEANKKFYEAVGESCESYLDKKPVPEVADEIRSGKYQVDRDRGRFVVRPDSGLGGYEMIKEDGKWRVVNPD